MYFNCYFSQVNNVKLLTYHIQVFSLGISLWIFCAGEDVVFIANDWHTTLLPCYLKSIYKPNGIYMSAKVSFLCSLNIILFFVISTDIKQLD